MTPAPTTNAAVTLVICLTNHGQLGLLLPVNRVVPLTGPPEAQLRVMRRVLNARLENLHADGCLMGIGSQSNPTQAIVDAWLRQNDPTLPSDLRSIALATPVNL